MPNFYTGKHTPNPDCITFRVAAGLTSVPNSASCSHAIPQVDAELDISDVDTYTKVDDDPYTGVYLNDRRNTAR